MIDEKEYGNVLMDCTKKIVELESSMRSYHHRLDDINKLADNVHELAKSVAQMSSEVKLNTETVSKNIETLQASAKEQGQRLGSLETDVRDLKHYIKYTEKNTERLDKFEREPGERWKNITLTAITVLMTAIITYVLSRVLNG